MIHAALTLAALVLAGGDPYADRPRHPLARSLPVLTREENDRIEAVVDRFIQLEVGKLPKAQEKQAKEDLYRLGPEAIFALVDGFNRAAQMESSCATVTIGKKIESIVRATSDPDLVSFVRENVGAGVPDSGKRPLPLTNALRSVQTTCLLRKGELLRRGLTGGPGPALPKALGSMSMAELEKAAGRERGEPLRKVLAELARRPDIKAATVLGKVAAGSDPEARKLARVLLVKHAEAQSPSQLKTLLRHDSADVRAAAARAVGSRGLRYGGELIALLEDDEPAVQQAARAALTQLAGGMDLGPTAARWRQWWQGQ